MAPAGSGGRGGGELGARNRWAAFWPPLTAHRPEREGQNTRRQSGLLLPPCEELRRSDELFRNSAGATRMLLMHKKYEL